MSTEIRKVNPCQMVRLLGFFVPCRARRAPKSSKFLDGPSQGIIY